MSKLKVALVNGPFRQCWLSDVCWAGVENKLAMELIAIGDDVA
jgi:hypothetical protein